jgi:hypothetical protein
VARSCQHGNEHSGSIKGGEFPDQLCDYQLLVKSVKIIQNVFQNI